ncbi:MAG: hypothetical protein FJ202_08015 [Gemmatimonadetes bacterium]|nr:hypothetical protein [Gemmatimonadota bacterium]
MQTSRRHSQRSFHLVSAATFAWRTAAVAVATAGFVATSESQEPNARFGRWKLKSDAPAPQSNIMTYEPSGANGMKVTVTSVNARGDTTSWWYTTEFDGKDMPVSGNSGTTHTAVRRINNRVNEIVNKRDGKVTQVLTNVLSPDGNTIGVIYMRDDGNGTTSAVTFATYERIR